MTLAYKSQYNLPIIGTKNLTTMAVTPVTLTAAYDVANKTKAIEVGGHSKLNLDVKYTMGATETANSIEIRVRVSPDGVNYYRIPNEAVSAGTSTIAQNNQKRFLGVFTSPTAVTIYSLGTVVF